MMSVSHLAIEIDELEEGKTVMVVTTGGFNTISPTCPLGSSWRRIILQ